MEVFDLTPEPIQEKKNEEKCKQITQRQVEAGKGKAKQINYSMSSNGEERERNRGRIKKGRKGCGKEKEIQRLIVLQASKESERNKEEE